MRLDLSRVIVILVPYRRGCMLSQRLYVAYRCAGAWAVPAAAGGAGAGRRGVSPWILDSSYPSIVLFKKKRKLRAAEKNELPHACQ